jgi:Leucine-rich repeat (LRR) protein
VLNITGNGISALMPFGVLYNLRELHCENNRVSDVAEVEAIISLSRLEVASFIGNPW